ncbi:MAG TPA: cyclic nucleotide-binding domain-containing protein [Burkholderiales bacterium]|nr:cyclic nucleotide-binding domain-containing protein [Burkholderiales bacterium]
MTFLKQAYLFEDLMHGDLARLARIVHERSYHDGEYITEEGKPGAALFVLRSGLVEITRRIRSGKEAPLATLEPPASFDELAAVGEVVRWNSARARGPVHLVALGYSDLDALSGNFPALANKILKKLAQITAARLQMLVESQYFGMQDQEPERDSQA